MKLVYTLPLVGLMLCAAGPAPVPVPLKDPKDVEIAALKDELADKQAVILQLREQRAECEDTVAAQASALQPQIKQQIRAQIEKAGN